MGWYYNGWYYGYEKVGDRMKTLIIVIAILLLIFILIIGGLSIKIFKNVFKRMKDTNNKRIEMHKYFELMKREVEDRHNKLR